MDTPLTYSGRAPPGTPTIDAHAQSEQVSRKSSGNSQVDVNLIYSPDSTHISDVHQWQPNISTSNEHMVSPFSSSTLLLLMPLSDAPPLPQCLEDAISVMANHVEEMGNGGEIMQVPPGEDISERLTLVTALSGRRRSKDITGNDSGDGMFG